jgi:transposase
VINAILWKLRTGAPWRDLPERYGPWKTAHERLRRWTADGTWDRILAEAITKDDSVGAAEQAISIDSSHIRAHQHAAGARKKRGCATGWVNALACPGEGIGRSRGGLTSKIHLGCGRTRPADSDPADRRPLRGQPQLLPLLDQIQVPRSGPGRPLSRPDRVVADKAYSHPSTRQALRHRGIAFTSPERADQIHHRASKGARGGRPPGFHATAYADRNVVERCFNRLKQFRDLATRYAKRAAYYQAELTIAATILWLRNDLQDTA